MAFKTVWPSWFAVVLALAIPAAAVASEVVGVTEGVVAELVKRNLPRYPVNARRTGDEGWVDVSFVIGVDGKPHDFLVEDSMGPRPFERSAVAALKQWRYKPAELDGEPVQQCHNRVRMLYQLDEKNGASRKFRKRYRKATQQIEEGDLAALKSTIEDLDPTRIYEAVYTSYLSAIAAEMEGDTSAQLTNLRRVISYTNFDTRDSVEVRGTALRHVFVILANQGAYASALQIHEMILESDLPPSTKDSSRKLAEEIQLRIGGDARLERQIALGPTRELETGLSMQGHLLSRRIVALDEVEGELDHLDLRCDFHRAVAEPKPGRGLRLPKEWGDCRVYVFGEPGAQFKIVEYADSEFVEAPST